MTDFLIHCVQILINIIVHCSEMETMNIFQIYLRLAIKTISHTPQSKALNFILKIQRQQDSEIVK